MSSTAHSSTQRFPNEVLSLICEDVSSTETLWALCRTSRTLFVIAQPILYRCVKLDGRRMGSVRNWCRTVSKHTHLAERVRSLELTLPALGILDPQDAQKIFTVMRRCVNLEEIEVASHSPHSDEGAPCMLPVTPFPRLIKLRTPHFYLDESFIEFVQSQPTIRTLELHKSGGSIGAYQQWRSCDAANLLPQLIAVAGPIHALPLNHHLERIETEPRVNDLGFLARYSASLTTLNLVLPQFDVSRMLKPLIRSAAAHLPALVHLALVETRPRDIKPHPFRVSWAYAPVGAFSGLETFTLMVRSVTFFGPPDAPLARHPRGMEKGMCDLALSTLDVCPILNRVVFGYEDSEKKERTCTAIRGPGGVVSTKVEDGMNFGAVSMFWV